MENPTLTAEVEQLVQAGFSKQEIIGILINKGHSDQEITNALTRYPFREGGSVIGIIMIVMAVIVGFTIKSTFGSFQYEFDSSGDFYRLNEWVIKPFLSLALLFAGINLVRSRNNVNKSVKIFMIVAFSIFVIVSGMVNAAFPLLLGIGGIVLFSITKVPVFTTPESTASLVKSTREFKPVNPDVLKQTDGEPWKGSAVYLPIFLFFILLISSPIEATPNENSFSSGYATAEEILSRVSKFDLTLVWFMKVLWLGTLVTGILMSINVAKYRYALIGLTAVALVHTVLVLFHPVFQSSIIPAGGIVLSGAFVILSNKWLPKTKSALV